MATFFVTEFRGVAASGLGITQAPLVPPLTEQKFTFTSSTASAPFSEQTQIVGIMADADCHVAWAASPTATTNNMKMPANVMLYFAVRPDVPTRVAAIVA